MFYKALGILFILSVTSCDVTIDNTDTSGIASAGLYTGTITATGGVADTAIAIITSTGKVAVVDIDTKEAFIGTRVDNSLTGTLYASTSVPSTAEITSVSGDNISGTYTSSLGGGTFALVANTDLYNRTADLSKLAGNWIDSVFTNALGLGTSTWSFTTNGAFTVSTGVGCYAEGAFTIIEASKNEYAMTMEITTCGSYDGAYTGFAVLSDTVETSTVDGTLSLFFSNGVFGGMAQPIK